MRITKYNVEKNEFGTECLVKESSCNYPCAHRISSAEDVAAIMRDVYRLDRMSEEHMFQLALDSKGKVLGVFEVSHGTKDYTVCSPKDVMKRALLSGAVSMLLIHNHPSGSAEPSRDDKKVAQKMKEACELMEIAFLDFIILGEYGEYMSFAAEKFI